MISTRTVLRSKYAVSMLILGALTGVLALPEVALSFANVTYGIGLLLVPVIFNLFFYGLCFAPIAYWGRRAWMATLVLVSALAFAPGLFALVQQERMVRKIAVADVSTGLEKAPKVLDLVGDLSRRWPSPKTDKTCGWVCQHSLQSGAVELVRMFDAQEPSSGKSGLAYRLDANGEIVFTEDVRPAELTLSINELRAPSKINEEYGFSDLLGVDIGLLKQLRATSGEYVERESASILWQQTGYFAGRAGIPAVFMPNIVGLKNMRNPGGIKVFSKSIATRISVNDATDALKLYSHHEAWQRFRERDPEEELESATALLRSVFGAKAAVSPNSASLSAAKDWARFLARPRHLQQRGPTTLSEADRTMVRNMYAVGEKRLWNPIVTAILADGALLNEFLPQAFDSAYEDLEAAGFAKALFLEMRHSNLSQEELSPFAPQLRTLMEKKVMSGENLYSFYLLPLASRFGIDLRPFFENLSFEVLKTTHRNWTSHMCQFPLRDLDDLSTVLQERLREDDRPANQQMKLPIFVDRHDYETRCRMYQ
ncbi:MAG: hypothetical protein AAFW87_14180 [Pseudomonadota bacterium]